MTYNVHGCLGLDGRTSPERIAEVIARSAPDIVCLQELSPAHGQRQASLIADALSVSFHSCISYDSRWGRSGNGIFSRLPMRLVREGPLPHLRGHFFLEPRSALWVEVEAAGGPLQLINTHLSLSPRERRMQAEALMGADWAGGPECRGRSIVCGDLNAAPFSKSIAPIRERFAPSLVSPDEGRPHRTYASVFPVRAIDHVFLDRGMKALRSETPSSPLEKIASDHLPLVADLDLGRP